MASLFSLVGDLALENADRGYPLSMHIPHSLISVARYRQWRDQEGLQRQWLYDLVASIFTHSQGGGIACKMLLQGKLPQFYLAERWDYCWVHCLAYLATYWSPRDIIYKKIAQPHHPLRLFCFGMDSLDAISSLFGLVDAARSTFPRHLLLPAMMGAVLTSSGAFCRGLDARSRGERVPSPLAAPSNGMARGAAWALLYWYLSRGFRGGKHRNKALVGLTWLWIVLDYAEDFCGFDAHELVLRPLAMLVVRASRALSLGPHDEEKASTREHSMSLRMDAFSSRQE
eukprot:TRINITY_DN29952_c0_g1_i1.p1 TRINITY_DN29952_c0_g1~~TRINITY_DN29952_c0_g1_i1.p1  ORF type:complete len:300 (-),score=41.68 TRINITY_DN29952_c0_g1_i1:2-856(-)